MMAVSLLVAEELEQQILHLILVSISLNQWTSTRRTDAAEDFAQAQILNVERLNPKSPRPGQI